jgi:hypothetical protein
MEHRAYGRVQVPNDAPTTDSQTGRRVQFGRILGREAITITLGAIIGLVVGVASGDAAAGFTTAFVVWNVVWWVWHFARRFLQEG